MTTSVGAGVQRRPMTLARAASAWMLKRGSLLVLSLTTWELGARLIDSWAVPPVVVVLESTQATVTAPAFWSAVGATLQGWAMGTLLAAAIGIPAGLLIGAGATSMRLTRGVVEFMRTVPAIMLVPLLVLLYGSTTGMKAILVCLAATWPILLQSAYGMRGVDRVARESVSAFRVPPAQRIGSLYLPSAAPLIATGLRLAATVGLLIAIGTEIVTSAPGIGSQISLAQANADAAKSYIYIFAGGLLGVLINRGFALAERRLLFWHAAHRGREAAS